VTLTTHAVRFKGDVLTVLAAADEDGDYLLGRRQDGLEGVFPENVVEKMDDDDAGDAGENAAVTSTPVTAAPEETTASPETETVNVEPTATEPTQVAVEPTQVETPVKASPETLPVPSKPASVTAPAPVVQPRTSGPPDLPKKCAFLIDHLHSILDQLTSSAASPGRAHSVTGSPLLTSSPSNRLVLQSLVQDRPRLPENR
jgi:outer membrane biosynthesis protein TonB